MNTALKPLDFLVFRTPLLPFSDCQQLSVPRLKALYGQTVLQEALLLASPELSEVLRAWQRGEITAPKEQEKKETDSAGAEDGERKPRRGRSANR